MGLYALTFDGETYFVEADSFQHAIDAWKEFVKELLWGTDYNGREQPESLSRIINGPSYAGGA